MRSTTWGPTRLSPSTIPSMPRLSGQAVLDGRADRGVIICGSGAGASSPPTSSRDPCRVAHDDYIAHQMVEHDDVNVICLGSRVIGKSLAEDLSRASSTRSSAGRTTRPRLEKIRRWRPDQPWIAPWAISTSCSSPSAPSSPLTDQISLSGPSTMNVGWQ